MKRQAEEAGEEVETKKTKTEDEADAKEKTEEVAAPAEESSA